MGVSSHMRRRCFLRYSVLTLFSSGITAVTAADDRLPSFRSHTFTVPARIERSLHDGGERLFISQGEQTFQFFYASHEAGRRLSPFPFILEAGKIYTFTVEERPFPSLVTQTPTGSEPVAEAEYVWYPVLIRVMDGETSIFDMEVCEVHQTRMERREVPISFGLPPVMRGLPTLEEEKTLFPHRRDYVLGGRVSSSGKRTETMYICSECKAAYDSWRKSHPEPSE